MNRLTFKEAQEYIPVSEDFTDSEPAYFTIAEPNKEGWCDVTYYTMRRKNNINIGEGDSWVYVMSNESMPGNLKIGFTRANPIERAKQLSSSTGVATPFNVEFSFQCFNAEMLESELHKFFEEYRVSHNREFFRLSIDEAKKAVENLGQRYV